MFGLYFSDPLYHYHIASFIFLILPSRSSSKPHDLRCGEESVATIIKDAKRLYDKRKSVSGSVSGIH
jgi:hypothetical protein